MRLKALVIQGGEIPPPVKPNQQPVLSLGVEAARSDLSVDKGVCEPQCDSVKPISPVNVIMRRSRPCMWSQTATGRPLMVRNARAPPWSKGVASTRRVASVPGRSGDLLMGKQDKAYKAEEC